MTHLMELLKQVPLPFSASTHDVNPGYGQRLTGPRRPSTIPLVAAVSVGSMYLGLKTRTVMARRERAAQDGDRNYQVDTHRSGEFESRKP